MQVDLHQSLHETWELVHSLDVVANGGQLLCINPFIQALIAFSVHM